MGISNNNVFNLESIKKNGFLRFLSYDGREVYF